MLTAIHRDYARAGADLLLANTFGANPRKLAGTGHSVEEVVTASIACARTAARETGALVALDIGPIGELLAPAGSLAFEDAVDQFAAMVEAGVQAGADLVFLETMTDLYELKAALLAVKEHSSLPVFASMSFEANGRTFTGCTVESFAATAAGLGADALGINCSLGPVQILPFIRRLCRLVPADLPVFVKPNAGLPNPDGSYDLTPAEFAREMQEYLPTGISMAGGCCGTTPETIRLLSQALKGRTPGPEAPPAAQRALHTGALRGGGRHHGGGGAHQSHRQKTAAAGAAHRRYRLPGRPGGGPGRGGGAGAGCERGPARHRRGRHAGTSGAGAAEHHRSAASADSSNPEALSRALRIYNGKPIVNSVNGERKTLDTILPLCRKYGAAVVGLTLDEHGIPVTAAERVAIAHRIVEAAGRFGIPPEDVYIDCLTLTASAQQDGAAETLKALSICKRELGVRTVLGVSNISFGLPCRGYLNATFLTMAMAAGLDLAIINPNTPDMMGAVRAYRVLTGQDEKSTDYIRAYADVQIQTTQTARSSAPAAAAAAEGDHTLADAVRRGLKAEARAAAEAALAHTQPLDLVNQVLIPALDLVGDGFEKGTIFLPQLLQSASRRPGRLRCGQGGHCRQRNPGGEPRRIVIATVKGDVHDIGKNIVRVILENYGYEVIDLGRDVPPETVVDTVRETGAPLVGLSALMTTTVPAMQATIQALHAAGLPCKVMVGGAVLTPEYARQIGADFYARDAKASADIAKQVFSC